MKIKAKDLTGAALDYAVALAEGYICYPTDGAENGMWWHLAPMLAPHGPTMHRSLYTPSTSTQGDDIIDCAGISVIRCDDDYETDAKGFCTSVRIPVWAATIGHHDWRESTERQSHNPMYQIDVTDVIYGRTRREAALRAYVAWKSGRNQWDLDGNVEVEIPEELL